MKTILIQIKDNKVLKILQSLKEIDLIRFISPSKQYDKKGLYELKPKNQSGKDSFFDLTGIWEGRDIDINSIRAEAWPNRK